MLRYIAILFNETLVDGETVNVIRRWPRALGSRYISLHPLFLRIVGRLQTPTSGFGELESAAAEKMIGQRSMQRFSEWGQKHECRRLLDSTTQPALFSPDVSSVYPTLVGVDEF